MHTRSVRRAYIILTSCSQLFIHDKKHESSSAYTDKSWCHSRKQTLDARLSEYLIEYCFDSYLVISKAYLLASQYDAGLDHIAWGRHGRSEGTRAYTATATLK